MKQRNYMGCQTVPIFCFHFLGHKKKSARNVFHLVMLVGVPVRILLSRTVSRRKQRGKTQGIENPVQERECNKNLVELLSLFSPYWGNQSEFSFSSLTSLPT